MQFKYKCLLTIPPCVFIVDQFTKYLVSISIPFGGKRAVIPGWFDIVHYTNTGAAFGMLAGADGSWRTPFFYGVSILALIAVVWYLFKLPQTEKMVAVALALVVGGIFGNGMDRIRFGAVTDFLSVHIQEKWLNLFFFGHSMRFKLEWPAFNVADSAITVAMFLLVWSTTRRTKINSKHQIPNFK